MNKLVGLGGVSRAGKTTLAHALCTSSSNITLIELDRFTLPAPQMPRINGRYDWEHPHSVDWPGVMAKIESENIPGQLILIEGILAFTHPRLNARYDGGLFMNLNHREYLVSRRQEKRWGAEPSWYLDYVWDAHLVYGRPDPPLANWVELPPISQGDPITTASEFLQSIH